MSPELLRLLLVSLRGRLVRTARMLRHPKYLVGFLIGIAWIVVWAGPTLMRMSIRVGLGDSVTEEMLGSLAPTLRLIAATGFAAAFSLAWLLPWGRLGMPFREAELNLLLAAPIPRRHLIQYGLLKNQGGIVIGAIVFTIFLGWGRPAERARLLVAFWLLLTLWDLLSKGRAMFLLRQRERPPRAAWIRRLVLVGGIVGFWIVAAPRAYELGFRLFEALREASGNFDLERIVAAIGSPAADTSLSWLLLPWLWAIAPLFALDAGTFVLSLLPLLGLLVLSNEAVVRSRARFEEPSFEHARREVRKRSPMRRYVKATRKARRRRPFVLKPVGRPELAVMWKNSIQITRWPLSTLARVAVTVVPVTAVVAAAAGLPGFVFAVMSIVGLAMMGFMPVMVGMAWNNDLRTELSRIELVRTWPVTSYRFVLAEVLTPALASLFVAMVGAGLALSGYLGAQLAQMLSGKDARILILPVGDGSTLLGMPYGAGLALFLLGALPLAGGIGLLSSALQNLMVLWFPAWTSHATDAAKGMAAMGHRLIFASALGLALMLGLLPSAALVAALVLTQWAAGLPWTAWAFPVWGLAAAAPPVVGALFIVRAAGRLWERLDPASELLESAS